MNNKTEKRTDQELLKQELEMVIRDIETLEMSDIQLDQALDHKSNVEHLLIRSGFDLKYIQALEQAIQESL